MRSFLLWLVGLAVALPMAAYLAGSLYAASVGDPPGPAPVILRDGGGSTTEPTPTREPDDPHDPDDPVDPEDTRQPDDEDVREVDPSPHRVGDDDDGDDEEDDGRGEEDDD